MSATCERCGWPTASEAVSECSDCLIGYYLLHGEPLNEMEIRAVVKQDRRVHLADFESVGGGLYKYTGDPNMPCQH